MRRVKVVGPVSQCGRIPATAKGNFRLYLAPFHPLRPHHSLHGVSELKFGYSYSMLVPWFQKCNKYVAKILKNLTKLWQKSEISHKTVKKLTKIRKNPNCDKNVSKNLPNYDINVSKLKMYLKSDKTHFKNVTKI